MSDSEWRSRIWWVVVHPHRPELLMVEQAGVLALPETKLRAKVWTADATATLPALRERVGLDAVLLRCVSEHEDPSARVQQATLVAAPRDTAPPPPGARWVGRDDLAGAAFQHDEHAAVAAGILDELAGGPAGAGRAPWAAPGWFHAAERWLRGSLDTFGYEVTRPVQQLRAWEFSCILRTPTAQDDVYFKAVRESQLFVNEALVTRPLAALFPDHVPASLAIDAEHRWMALGDFGEELGWEPPLRSARTCCERSQGCRSKQPPRSTGCSG